ncbi:MAG: DNA alkylation repair protein [bacterium]|nr:DNA alkylation repair protein [bacterium]
MEYQEIIKKINSLQNPRNIEGMARFGIRPKTKVYGVPIPELRKIAKIIKKNHKLALKLWDSKIHEARILAGFIGEPEKATEQQIEKWVRGFDSWDVCDQVCSSFLDKTEFAYKKVFEFSKRKEEFVKRTAFALIACLAVHNKKLKDKDFLRFFPLIKKESIDERNFVKKAVNWALRQIGKRNLSLNKKAIELAKEIRQTAEKNNSKSAKWIAAGAIRELERPEIKKRLKQ